MESLSKIANHFVEQINAQSVEGILELLSEDPLFVDGLGQSLRGRDGMTQAWRAYFRMVPDYRISVEKVMENGDSLGLFGEAQGTYAAGGRLRDENFWKAPAAWLMRVVRGRVAEWRVYCDNEPLRAIMRKNQQA